MLFDLTHTLWVIAPVHKDCKILRIIYLGVSTQKNSKDIVHQSCKIFDLFIRKNWCSFFTTLFRELKVLQQAFFEAKIGYGLRNYTIIFHNFKFFKFSKSLQERFKNII